MWNTAWLPAFIFHLESLNTPERTVVVAVVSTLALCQEGAFEAKPLIAPTVPCFAP